MPPSLFTRYSSAGGYWLYSTWPPPKAAVSVDGLPEGDSSSSAPREYRCLCSTQPLYQQWTVSLHLVCSSHCARCLPLSRSVWQCPRSLQTQNPDGEIGLFLLNAILIPTLENREFSSATEFRHCFGVAHEGKETSVPGEVSERERVGGIMNWSSNWALNTQPHSSNHTIHCQHLFGWRDNC